MAGVVRTTSPMRRSRTNRIRESWVFNSPIHQLTNSPTHQFTNSLIVVGELVGFDDGFVDEHYRNVVFDRVHALACSAFQGRTVLDERDGGFAIRTRENLEQLRIDGHVGNI